MIRERGHTNGDVALALLFYGGLAGGVLITGLAGQSAARLQPYLFGSITTISSADVVVTIGARRGGHRRSCVGLLPQLFAVAQDPEFAQVAGLRVRAYNMLVAVLAAVTVTVAMRTVGLLLVSALMVVPVATSQQLTRSFRTTLAAAMVLGVASPRSAACCSRRCASSTPTVAPGPTIVLLVARRLRRDLAARRAGCAAGSGCAPLPRRAVAPRPRETTSTTPRARPRLRAPGRRHGDHVDYVHDGHRHAPHGEHYDEH